MVNYVIFLRLESSISAIRHHDTSTTNGSSSSTAATVTTNSIGVTAQNIIGKTELKSSTTAPRTRRDIRQLRMFIAILVLMLTFLICRLPTWIFLLYKLYNPAKTNSLWMLHYCLGLLSITNCVLNPLLYTFLTESIQFSFGFFDRLRRCSQLLRSNNNR